MNLRENADEGDLEDDVEEEEENDTIMDNEIDLGNIQIEGDEEIQDHHHH